MSKTTMINPFFIMIEPMQRLLLVNFSKDPDEHYIGLEPQVFSKEENAETYVIIGWRRDGLVDVYYQSFSDVEDKDYDHTGKGLSEKIKTEFTNAHFIVTPKGVSAAFQFTDKYNREISIRISENHSNDAQPFSLLAPMGMATRKPTSFPMILLYDFYFVRKKESILEVKIAGKRHKLDILPMPIDGSRMSFTRYSNKPLIAYLNPALDDHIGVIKLKNHQQEYKSEKTILKISWEKSVPSIKKMTQINATYPIALTFSPPFPNIVSLENNQLTEGTFTIMSHPSVGKITGNYAVIRKGNDIKVKCCPSLGWLPVQDKWELRVLYRIAPVFTQWPKTYEWTGYITERNQSNYYMHSKWKRINMN
ncbi:MAG: hypothetical protein JJU01_01465 [Alkalibacterium sp.]|nr:hypothetical protein [Alkalibacterium sp.]TVP91842.1 MAG: hypothetical protein EA249_04435 [Alkalibacterium sp.]